MQIIRAFVEKRINFFSRRLMIKQEFTPFAYSNPYSRMIFARFSFVAISTPPWLPKNW